MPIFLSHPSFPHLLSPHLFLTQSQSAMAVIEENMETITRVKQLLLSNKGTPTFLHILQSVLEQVDKFLADINVSSHTLVFPFSSISLS